MRPDSGVVSPSAQSSSVVLPDPEGPNSTVNPGAALKSTSRENPRLAAAKVLRTTAFRIGTAGFFCSGVGMKALLFYRAYRPRFRSSSIQAIDRRQHGEAED